MSPCRNTFNDLASTPASAGPMEAGTQEPPKKDEKTQDPSGESDTKKKLEAVKEGKGNPGGQGTPSKDGT